MDGPLATLVVVSHERQALRDLAIASALRSVELVGADIPVLVIDSSRDRAGVPAGVGLMHVPDRKTCVSKRRLAVETERHGLGDPA